MSNTSYEKTLGNNFSTKIGDTQYANTEYLECERFRLETDSQDISSTLNYIGVVSKEFTALLTEVIDGDLGEVWATESSCPYDSGNEFVRIH